MVLGCWSVGRASRLTLDNLEFAAARACLSRSHVTEHLQCNTATFYLFFCTPLCYFSTFQILVHILRSLA